MLKLAVDFGTSMTKIYKLGSGIVLADDTSCAKSEIGGIRAFGNEAKRLLGKTASETDVIFPVYEGEITDERAAAALLEYFLEKVTGRGLSRIEILFCVPCGCRRESLDKYYRMAESVGVARVGFAEVPYLSALGQDVPLSESNPVFTVDIGAGVSSIAAFSLDGMIAGLSMNVGGNNMDIHIIDHIAETFNLKIGAQTSEKLKNTIGSLAEYDNQSMIVNGRDITTGKPRSVSVSSPDITLPIRIYVDKIIEYAELVLKKLPAEVSAAMCKNGVYLSGGICSLAGFAEYVGNKLQMEAHVAGDPQMSVVLGGGRAIGNQALLRRFQIE